MLNFPFTIVYQAHSSKEAAQAFNLSWLCIFHFVLEHANIVKKLYPKHHEICYINLTRDFAKYIMQQLHRNILFGTKYWTKNGPSDIFIGCLPQILLGPFLNTLSHLIHLVTVGTAQQILGWQFGCMILLEMIYKKLAKINF